MVEPEIQHSCRCKTPPSFLLEPQTVGGESCWWRYIHPFFSIPGFSPKQIRWCSMHTVNLGILQSFLGSLVCLLCENGCWVFLKFENRDVLVLFSNEKKHLAPNGNCLHISYYMLHSWITQTKPRILWASTAIYGWQLACHVIPLSKVGKGESVWVPSLYFIKGFLWLILKNNPYITLIWLLGCDAKEPQRHSQNYITTGLLNIADGYPSLTCKAYNGRLLLVFLDQCIHSCAAANSGHPEISNACIAARCLRCWFDTLEKSPRYLTSQQGFELYTLAKKFVQSLERLASIALRSNRQRWKFQPKLHPWLHIAEDHWRLRYNYRHCHCFIDEDFVGLVKRLAQKCHRGELLELRILCRYLLRLDSWVPGAGRKRKSNPSQS